MSKPVETRPTIDTLSRRTFLQRAGALAAGLLVTRCRKSPATTPVPSPLPQTTTQATGPFSPANAPLGTARGLKPGRVTWAYNPEVTRWNGTTGTWWSDENLNPAGVADMFRQALRAQADANDDASAWDALFRHFNASRGRGSAGYTHGQKIAIKLNLNVVTVHAYSGQGAFSAPQLVEALVRQLIENAGVPPAAIALYDATRYIPDAIYNRFQGPETEGVRFIDFAGGSGRDQVVRDLESEIHWSFDVQGNPTYLPKCVAEADYLINLASLRGHNLAGVTLCAKNHFGTICADLDGQPTLQAPQGANLHGTVAAHDYSWRVPDWSWKQRPMGSYNALVDLMAHPRVGENTLLFMLDGFYVPHDQNADVTGDCVWESAPFNGRWTSSLFLSQDGVAIDSVGLDFVRSEPTINRLPDVMPPHTTCENYLHEAALSPQCPSGTTYDPTLTGQPSASLGVHEHWNSATAKAYSRNLGTGEGIELVSIT